MVSRAEQREQRKESEILKIEHQKLLNVKNRKQTGGENDGPLETCETTTKDPKTFAVDCRQISLMNLNANILNKTLSTRINECIIIIVYQEQMRFISGKKASLF